MSRIRDRDTIPERKLRSVLHRAGYRFSLRRKDLPGRPDIVLPRYRTAIFVHGCFWHRHRHCRFAYEPKSNRRFWRAKFSGTVERDHRKAAELRRLGWCVVTVWECQLAQSPTRQLARVTRHLRSQANMARSSGHRTR